ncbi:cytochrome P450 [Halomicrobium sp. IBSBa]|uniref:cytochrome P450 n=1 Tax=Halomicrobium sp. IBSBa TaxID=2778916 RepID=UPI001ABFDE97|nr:cytochrome P450 [Halomicrobium sp. IBSBa]MBO4248820.1 cytochrome P450 [Halomicrobium sp. IBSBa]
MTTTDAPGPRGLPVIGNSHQWARDPCAFRERCAAEYGPVVNYEMLGWDTYMLTDPADVKRVLEDPDTFPKHEPSNAQLEAFVGNGLLTSGGDLWERQRAAIQPAFYMDHIRNYAERMVAQAAATADRWTAGESVDVRRAMTRCTLDILVDCLFGEDIDPAERGLYEAVEAFQAPLEPSKQPITFFAPDWAPVPFLRRADRALSHIDDQIYDILEIRRADESDRDDLVAMLLAADTAMDDEQIRDELVTFLFAGHETTALSMTYVWDLLSRNPTAQRRLHEEVDALDGRPTIEDVFDFEYTGAVIEEAMRLYPPAHDIRRSPATTVEIGGYTIPEGSLVTLPTWVLHRDERFWDDPERFRPERFLDGGRSDRPEYAYFPFGGGPRRCIGQQFAMTEAQLILATIAREWTLEREYGDLDLSAAVTLQPSHDVPMTPHERT